jgi:ribosomal protein S18 acetylase RimI-like enzyme
MNKLIPAKIEDVELLTNISNESFNTDYLFGGEPNDGPPNYKNVAWHHSMQRQNHLFSYYVDDVIIGGAILFKSGYKLYVGRIFIDPKYFKKGYGLQMMKEIENLYKDVTQINLETPQWNTRTNNFYVKCGYQVIGKDDDNIYFQKRIVR